MTTEKLIQENLKLVWHIAHRYHRPPMTDIDDLFQAGCMGLMKAAKAFDPQRGYRFSTLAGLAIAQEVVKLRTRMMRQSQHVPIDRLLRSDDPDSPTLAEALPAPDSVEGEALANILVDELRKEQPEIADMLLKGYTQTEIAKRMGVVRGAIFNRLKRFRLKHLV